MVTGLSSQMLVLTLHLSWVGTKVRGGMEIQNMQIIKNVCKLSNLYTL